MNWGKLENFVNKFVNFPVNGRPLLNGLLMTLLGFTVFLLVLWLMGQVHL